MWTPIRSLLAIACLLAVAPAHAVRLADMQVRGIEDPAQLNNALQSISLQRLDAKQRSDLTEDRLSYLLRKATEEIRTALEPYGYYDTEVKPSVQRSGNAVTVTFDVSPGMPVRVRDAQVGMDGEGRDDPFVAAVLHEFKPVAGAVLDHRVYEASKTAVDRRLNQHGYFDADQPLHKVEVTRATHTADIALHWNSGVRYRIGETRFGKNQFKPGLLDPLVPWKTGDYYDQQQLLDLQQSLATLDYFGVIDVVPKLDEARDGKVPVTISTTPGKRNVYSAGVSYGTDSGAGVQLGFDRRWVNSRGDKLRAQIEYAQRLKIAATQYRIPAFGWLNGFYSLGASLRDEQTNAVNQQLFEIVAGRSGRLHGWNLDVGLHYQRERYQDLLDPGLTVPVFNRYATLVFPSLAAAISHGDDKLYPTHGWGLNADLRAGSTAIGSDVDFAQFRVQGRFVFSVGEWNRVLLRGELGRTFTQDFARLPPSLRFFAGGDSSVRGYGYQEIGPKILDRVVGGHSLAVFSAEFEHRFTSQWGAAAFVDAGDAFDDHPDMHVGIGFGLRWRSPVGPVRIDLAHGLNDPQQGIRLHLNIGTDL